MLCFVAEGLPTVGMEHCLLDQSIKAEQMATLGLQKSSASHHAPAAPIHPQPSNFLRELLTAAPGEIALVWQAGVRETEPSPPFHYQ